MKKMKHLPANCHGCFDLTPPNCHMQFENGSKLEQTSTNLNKHHQSHQPDPGWMFRIGINSHQKVSTETNETTRPRASRAESLRDATGKKKKSAQEWQVRMNKMHPKSAKKVWVKHPNSHDLPSSPLSRARLPWPTLINQLHRCQIVEAMASKIRKETPIGMASRETSARKLAKRSSKPLTTRRVTWCHGAFDGDKKHEKTLSIWENDGKILE